MLSLDADAVAKDYPSTTGRLRAVDGISLQVPRGKLFGFLGPNGAGKTTFMRMIHAVLPPTAGRLEVLGFDVTQQARRLKARLGVLPQENNLDPDFTVEKNLLVYARYFDIPRGEARRRARDLLAFVGLEAKAKEPVDALSGGMKRRLLLARALVNEPDLLILDEPTTGLDPQARHSVWEKVRALRRKGITVFLTTHYMEEAERLCDELVILDRGRILVRGAPPALIEQHASREVLELGFDGEARHHDADLRRLAGVDGHRVEFVGDRALLYVPQPDAVLVDAKARLPVRESIVRRGGLEDVFLHLTGRGLRE